MARYTLGLVLENIEILLSLSVVCGVFQDISITVESAGRPTVHGDDVAHVLRASWARCEFCELHKIRNYLSNPASR